MPSLLEIIKKTTDYLATKGVDNPRFNAEHIIGHALGLKRMQLYVQFERLLSEAELEKIRPLVRRRAQREPLAYVLGDTDFCGLGLLCDRRALIPRPETEELVELAASLFKDAAPPARILDLGTGTGCIALALARLFPAALVTALDASQEALSLARANAEKNGLLERICFMNSDWFVSLPPEARFELVVSNPPYLSEQELGETLPEVKLHEPRSALTAAEEGLADLRRIIQGTTAFLSPGGYLALETGPAQHPVLLGLLRQLGFAQETSRKDLSGRARFLSARLG